MLDPRLKDKAWRMSHLYKIRTKDGKLKVFKRNRAQAHFNANKHTRNLILKSRQLGITTDETIDTLDDALFTKNLDALFIAHQKEDAEEIFDKKVRIAWENIPLPIRNKYKVETNRTNQMSFDFMDGNKSSFLVKVSGRSGTYRRLHISEFAKVCAKEPKKAKEMITGSIPAVPIDGRVDIEGTAEGEIGYFAEMFWEAWDREREPLATDFKAFFYNWTWDDDEIAKIDYVLPYNQMDEGQKFEEYAIKHNLTGKQITYYYLKWLSLKKDWAMLHQEYPTTPQEAFVSTGNKLFDMEVIENQPVRDGEVVGDWTFYARYNPRHTYGVGADPSEGIGGDNATIVVIDFTEGEVVAVFCSKYTPADILAYEAVRVAKLYGNAILAPERNNHGHAFIVAAKEIYDNLYEEVVVDKVTDTRTKKYGFHTNARSKPKILLGMNTALNEGDLKIPSKALVRECRTYLREDMNEVEHTDDTIGHWDRLMACFVKGTMILTEKGQRPIETLQIGDKVLTRQGYKPIIATMSSLKPVIENIGLVGTIDHPVFCNNNEIKDLVSIGKDDILYQWNLKTQKIERQSTIKVLHTIDTQMQNRSHIDSTIKEELLGKSQPSIYIAKFGLIIMGLFQKVFIYIIKMIIKTITILATLKCYQQKSIINYTQTNQNLKKNLDKDSKTIEIKLIKGSKITIKIKLLMKSFVMFVALIVNHLLLMLNTVLQNAQQKLKIKEKENRNKNVYVQSVIQGLKHQYHTKKDVQKNVLIRDKEIVYNIQVAECPEYFANNILVHNCAIAWEMRLYADYIDPNDEDTNWDDDENVKRNGEELTWEEKFKII